MEAGYKHTEKHTTRGLDFPSTAWGKKKTPSAFGSFSTAHVLRRAYAAADRKVENSERCPGACFLLDGHSRSREGRRGRERCTPLHSEKSGFYRLLPRAGERDGGVEDESGDDVQRDRERC